MLNSGREVVIMNSIGIVKEFCAHYEAGLVYKIDVFYPKHKIFKPKAMVSKVDNRDIEPGTPVACLPEHENGFQRFQILSDEHAIVKEMLHAQSTSTGSSGLVKRVRFSNHSS